MPRPEKVHAVEEIKEKLQGSEAVFITEYRGLSVSSMQTLRRSLREASAEYKIYKMSLARLAATEAGLDDLIELLQGPTAVAFTQDDPVPPAKALKTFADENGLLVLKGGLLAGETLTAEKVMELAELDSREVLLAKVAGAFQAPMANLAQMMSALLRGTANLVSQLIEKREAAGETVPPAAAPEEEAAADETPAAEAVEEGTAEETPAAEVAAADADQAPADQAAAGDDAKSDETPADEAESSESDTTTAAEDPAEEPATEEESS